MHETGLVRYDSMCRAIAEAHAFDEVKDIRDKMLALEQYARQAKNMDAERKACEIRLRAERRCGEMLKESAESGERATKESNLWEGPKSRDTTSGPTLSDIGISRDQSSRWQKLASVPEAEFEEALRDPEQKPTTAGIIRKANGNGGEMHPNALWLWGRARDFERMHFANGDPHELLGEMTQTMQADIGRIAPLMADYFSHLIEALHVTH